MSEQDIGFVRQRRNLMIISLLLLFSEIAELRVSKLSAFGNELLIGAPQAVNAALWDAGVYWLIRFYQYSRPIFRGSIQGTLLPQVQALAPAVALEVLLTTHPDLTEQFPDLQATPKCEISSHTLKGGITTNYDIQIELSVMKSAMTARAKIEQEFGPYVVRLTRTDLWRTRARAWLHLILHTRVFTDLILPYILFALPIVYVAYDSLDGLLRP